MAKNNRNKWLAEVEHLTNRQTPYILTDLSVIIEKVKEMKALLPRVKIFYALKSNSYLPILQALDKHVDGYDIASIGELKILEELNVTPQRLLYSNPVKVPSHIKESYQKGVRYYAFDSLDEIHKLSEYAPNSNVFLRIQVSDYGSKFPLSRKFGLQAVHVVEYATAAKTAGLNVCGLAFHVGSQSENLQVWETAFETCGELIGQLKKFGITITYLDIGGGFPADYGQPIPTIAQVCRAIEKAIKKNIPSNIEIVAEPGRHISANATVTVSSVIAREHRSGSDWLYLDMGVFQGLMEPLEMKEWRYPIYTNKSTRGLKKDFVLTGPTCDAYDTLGYNYSLPADIALGDRLIIAATGAYSTVYSSSFNGFEVPRSYYIR